MFRDDSMTSGKAQSLAAAYTRRHGGDYTPPPAGLIADVRRGQDIADAYLDAPLYDRAAIDAYAAFASETAAQYAFMTRHVSHTSTPADPYATADALFSALDTTGHLDTLATKSTGGHPFLPEAVNDMFRAVHDYFGHYATGRDFGRDGEEAAWFSHSQMYSPTARLALTTETRGQNSALNWRLGGSFPVQKVALLDPRFSDTRAITVRTSKS